MLSCEEVVDWGTLTEGAIREKKKMKRRWKCLSTVWRMHRRAKSISSRLGEDGEKNEKGFMSVRL